jgi:UDP-N-acetylglucosamine 2-epimerase (non-hydrolysing)
MLIHIVVGARPNFMKVAPILKALKYKKEKDSNIVYKLIHTGQHYDYNMSGSFFEQLEIPAPDIFLNGGSGTQAEQTASIMISFEKELLKERPSIVIVVGDVNSTMACTIVAKKLNIVVAHVEAGIRSYDLSMPEEINRLVTDSIADYFFTTTKEAGQNLVINRISNDNIFFVGNTMIDTLLQNLEKLNEDLILKKNNIKKNRYFILTLHRPSNVDDYAKLKTILDTIEQNIEDLPIIFPVHPRTNKVLIENNFCSKNIILSPPLSYHDFIGLIKNSKGIVTDSGGVTEEATVLSVPCVTLRNTTERPETVNIGTNELVGDDMDLLKQCIKRIIRNDWKKGSIPELWDGKSAIRIVNILTKLNLNNRI